MKRVGTLACLLFSIAGASAGFAQPSSVDWKVYGAAKLVGDTVTCFYDANSVFQQPDGRIQVWTKCLPDKEMDFDQTTDIGKKIVDNVARKVIQNYVSPYAVIGENVDFDKNMEITVAEEIANIGYIQPRASIFYELNCSERMLRELSISIQTNGKNRSGDTPKKWTYVPPEGNAANLLKLLCRRRPAR